MNDAAAARRDHDHTSGPPHLDKTVRTGPINNKKKNQPDAANKSIHTAVWADTPDGYHELSSPARAPCTKAL